MTKTHQEDNEILHAAQKSIRALKADGHVPSNVDGISVTDVLASNSVFELADKSHLGRSRTRRGLSTMITKHTLQLAQAHRAQKEGATA